MGVVHITILGQYREVNAFVPSYYQHRSTVASRFGLERRNAPSILSYADTPDDLLSEIKASEIEEELESYGISTQTMFDRNEFEKALKYARLNDLRERKSKSFNEKGKKRTSSEKKTWAIWGKTKSRKRKNNAAREKWSSRWNEVASTAKDVLESLTKKSSDYSSTKENSVSSKNKNSRQQRYRMATEEGKAMNLSDLKKELTDRGISTTTFFEKSDMIDAYANAVAENVKNVGKKSRQHRKKKL